MDQARPCVLLAEDEPALLDLLRRALATEDYNVLVASNGLEALALAQKHRPDVMVLDIIMPGLDGLELCRQLRQDPTLAHVPVLFLTVRGELEQRLEGWEQGCDGYLTKPFDLRELRAHVRALLRRGRVAATVDEVLAEEAHVVEVGSLTLDLHRRRVTTSNRCAQLTPTEFKLLRHFMAHPDQLFSSRQLFKEVWGYALENASPGLVRWHIKNLREKIEPDPQQPKHLRTVPGYGYMLVTDV
jgi:DNA-binding response OmpR family regulator